MASVERKQWDYSKGETKLNFSLRINIKEEMKNFVELLERAVEDVKAQIEKTK